LNRTVRREATLAAALRLSGDGPQRWKVSDWKNVRLEAYRLLVKGATIYRGGSEPITRDVQVGNLRDTYYEDAYSALEPPQGA
jgi:hypothetical protein